MRLDRAAQGTSHPARPPTSLLPQRSQAGFQSNCRPRRRPSRRMPRACPKRLLHSSSPSSTQPRRRPTASRWQRSLSSSAGSCRCCSSSSHRRMVRTPPSCNKIRLAPGGFLFSRIPLLVASKGLLGGYCWTYGPSAPGRRHPRLGSSTTHRKYAIDRIYDIFDRSDIPAWNFSQDSWRNGPLGASMDLATGLLAAPDAPTQAACGRLPDRPAYTGRCDSPSSRGSARRRSGPRAAWKGATRSRLPQQFTPTKSP